MDIDDWRARIDAVDLKILDLLSERANYCIEIGKIKQRLHLPIYMPERENQIYQTVEAANPGPLSGAAVRRLFERIIDESRRVEAECNT
jgi:chorismate mutase-like protein